MQWQYYASTATDLDGLTELLATVGLDGWELVSMTENTIEYTVVFKRPAR